MRSIREEATVPSPPSPSPRPSLGPGASFFFGARIWLGTILGRFSIIYFSGLGLRIRVRVWVWVRVMVGLGLGFGLGLGLGLGLVW